MDKISFANTAKLGFWDFVIDATDREAPKLVSGDYKDLRAKIESGELIDGVIVMLLKEPTYDTVRYSRLYSWSLIDVTLLDLPDDEYKSEFHSLGTLIVLNFQDSPGVAIKENNEVITSKGPSAEEGGDGK